MGRIAPIEELPVPESADFKRLLEALDNVILILDRTGSVAYANAPAEDFFGLGRKALLGAKLETVLGPQAKLCGLIERARERGGVVSRRDMAILLGRKGQARADVRAVPLPDRPGFVVISILPLSFGEEVGRMMGTAGDRNSGMGAILAHEIKNPLAGIRGAAQLLARKLDREQADLSRLIIEECDRIRALIERMERLGSVGLKSKQRVNIHRILDQVIARERAAAPDGVAFERQYDPSLPALEGDAELLLQCFQNLIRNAVEAAGGPHGVIKIRTAFEPGLRIQSGPGGTALPLPLEITISDNGPGVPEEDRERIFQPFVSTRREGSGTGLGLALVRRIAAAHGGIAMCDPSTGGGRFRILFPLYKEAGRKRRETAA